MVTKNNEQIQIRIDAATKKRRRRSFDGLGIDISSAVKLFFRQVIKRKNIPFELRGENGLTLRNAEALRESIVSAKNSGRSFKSGGLCCAMPKGTGYAVIEVFQPFQERPEPYRRDAELLGELEKVLDLLAKGKKLPDKNTQPSA
jgi:addiction module RelB/DinJ family antitoxin